MYKFFILILSLIILAGCAAEQKTADSAPQNKSEEKTGPVSVEYKTEPAEVKAGEPAELRFEVRSASGGLVKEMEIVHEKPMHLLIVSEDLAEFYHVHPEQQADGTFKIPFTFPNGGAYRLYADLKPSGGAAIVKDFTQKVAGAPRAREALQADDKFERTVDGLRVVMTPSAALESGKDLTLGFRIFDAASNRPVTDLEKYLGEYAHFVIISEDLRDFVHAHPMSGDDAQTETHSHAENASHVHDEKSAGSSGVSAVAAHVAFPNAAKYKIWAQFQRAGRVITVPFVVDVKQGAAKQTLSEAKVPEGAVKVVVSKDGFTPDEVAFGRGKPLKLAFVRVDAENCGTEVVFKDLNIKRELPVGEAVVIDVPTEQAGEITFACGMNMYRGKVLIR